MILRQSFDGRDQPFEGERRLILSIVPAGAKILAARAALVPAAGEGGAPPLEAISFAGEAWGATKVRLAGEPGWVEVDLHGRRTLHSVAGAELMDAALQIDLGGVFAGVNTKGGLVSPADPAPYKLHGDDELLPGLTVTRFRLEVDDGHPDVGLVRVRSGPRNVSLAVGAEPPFFAFPGELARRVEIADWKTVLAAFLAADAPSGGFHRVPLVLRSDALGRLDLEVEVELLEQQSLLPPGLAEINVPYTFDAMPAAHGELELRIPPGMRVRATEGQAVGAFADSRIVLGPLGEPPSPLVGLALAADRVQARLVQPDARIEIAAVDLLAAAVSRRVRFEVDLLEDLGGKPGGGSLLERPAPFTLDREAAGRPTWVSVPLASAAQLGGTEGEAARPRAWLAVKVLEGDALWFAGEGGPAAAGAMQQTTDGGLSWRRTEAMGLASPAAQFRFRNLPATFKMPLELQVGRGEAARRVSFKSREALGRIDLGLDLPELAAAFNDVLAAQEAPFEGELLANPDFTEWTSRGEALGEPQYVTISPGSVPRVAASPDGRFALVATAIVNDGPSHLFFETVDLACTRRRGIAAENAGDPIGLAVDPSSGLAYVGTSNHRLLIYEPSGPHLLASYDLDPRRIAALAFTPDGERLFFAETAAASTGNPSGTVFHLRSIPTSGLAGRGGGARLPAEGQIESAPLTGVPRAVAVSADGSRLFLLAADGTQRASPVRLRVFGAASLAPTGVEATLGAGFAGLVVLPATGRILSFGEADALESHDAERLASLGRIGVGEPARRAVAAGDGKRAFVLTGESLSTVDLARGRTLPGLALRGADLALTPDGDRLLVTLADPAGQAAALVIVPIGTPLPAAWTVVGPLRRECLGGAVPAIVLGERESDGSPFGLAQVVAAAPGRHEVLVEAAATEDDAEVAVVFLGDGCRPIQTATFPVPRQSLEDLRALPRLGHAVTAPAGTRQAEVQLRLPAGRAAVARISLAATANTLANGRLEPTPAGLPAGWELAPPAPPGFAATLGPDRGVRLTSAVVPVRLSQEVTVEPGQSYELAASGKSIGPAVVLAVTFLSATGAPAGGELALPFGQAARGEVPAGAARARLELRLPAGASLVLDRLAFALRRPARVSAFFLAEAPGMLRVRDFRIAFEPAAPPRPQPSPNGLCSPSLRGAAAGGKAEGCGEAAGGEAEPPMFFP